MSQPEQVPQVRYPLEVPLYDPDAHFSHGLRQELHAALDQVINQGYFHGGPALKLFEDRFARYTKTEHAVGVASGTIALYLTLIALGVGPGDEVITVPNTDIATTAAIRYTGARIVWVDVDERTHNLDPDLLLGKITERTRVIIPVHLYGLPADMDSILEAARSHGIEVVEDCALALGATYKGRPVGSFGVAGCFSFSETKLLGALGSGGMICTNDRSLAAELARIRSYGEAPEADAPASGRSMVPEREGLNVGLGALQAGFLNRKMDRLDGWLKRRREIADHYSRALAGTNAQPPTVPDDRTHAFRSYVLRVDNRDTIRQALYAQGIATATHYTPPLHLQPVYRDLGHESGDFPRAERLASELLCLPIYPELGDRQVARVTMALKEALGLSAWTDYGA